ncbi:MAG: hypothetical protein ABIF82_00840 [Planctomycetota bacterium]
MQRARLRKIGFCSHVVAFFSAAFVLGCENGSADWNDALVVPTGKVVLVKRGDTYGAFKILKQTKEPEAVTYMWCVRSDGGGQLGEPNIRQFRNLGRPSIQFAPFAFAWSYGGRESGWLYPSVGTSVCVTEETGWGEIDAASAEWRYRTCHEEVVGLWRGRSTDGLSENQVRGLLHFKQGRTKLSTGDFRGAIEEFDTAIRWNPHHDVAYTMRGDAHRWVFAFDKALQDYTEAASLGLEEALVGLAFTQFDIGDWRAARKVFGAVLFYFPKNGWHLMAHTARACADGEWRPMSPDQDGALPTRHGKALALASALYTGKIQVEECLSKAAEETSQLTVEALCRVKFYVAEYYLLNGQPAKAATLLQECLDTKTWNWPEFPSAHAELQRLRNP